MGRIIKMLAAAIMLVAMSVSSQVVNETATFDGGFNSRHYFNNRDGRAVIEVYASSGGGGGQGGNRREYACGTLNLQTCRSRGRGGGGGSAAAAYMKFYVTGTTPLNINVGNGGSGGSHEFVGWGSGSNTWQAGFRGGDGGQTRVIGGGHDLIIDGGKGGGEGRANGACSGNLEPCRIQVGGSGAPIVTRPLGIINNQSYWQQVGGDRGDDGAYDITVDCIDGNGGDGGDFTVNSITILRGAGGQGGFDNVAGSNGAQGQVLIRVTYLHAITFDLSGGLGTSNLEVPNGTTIAKPTAPIKSGFIFDGWFNEDLITPWDFETIITESITIYAKWTENTFSQITPIGPQTYTRSAITPPIEVKDGENILTENIDYSVDYTNNINVGQATVIVTGIGKYSGTVTANFDINPADISEAIVLANSRQYTGEPITTVVSVRLGLDYLEEDEDYLVVYSDSVNIGEVTVTVTGIVNYSGTATGTFIISAASPIDVPVIWENLEPFTFDRTNQGPTPIAITDKGDTLELVPNAGHSSVVGEHIAWALLLNPNHAQPVNLLARTQDYEIQRRPLTIQVPTVFQNAENLDSAGLVARIRTQMNFGNFGDTPDNNNDSTALRTSSTITLTEQAPQSAPRQRSLELLRYRIYLLTITTDTTGEQTRNYIVNPITGTEIRVAQQCKTCQSWGNVCIATCNDEAFFNPTSIRTSTSPSDRYGIVLENAVVSDLARILVVTPEQATVNLAILDNLGNVMFSVETQCLRLQSCKIVWNLTNQSGRFVANGAYLIIAETTGISGRRYLYSTRIGVNR